MNAANKTSPKKSSIQRVAPTAGPRPGSLVLIGSGIRAIGQFSLEAQGYLTWADEVYYCVSDPATERWILEQQPRAVDLYTLYDNDKPRRITYVQMSESMLRPLREGKNVVGIFYGHPGVFVNPSHRAIAIARQEGHLAFMLPAVSSLDSMFADLGIDPSRPGLQIIEATDLVLRSRKLLPDSHVVILQVGSVGDPGFRFMGFPNSHLNVLIKYLQDEYGEDYEIIHYIASQYAITEPTIEAIALSDFLSPDIGKRVTGISTFYVPPKSQAEVDPEMARELNLRVPKTPPRATPSPFEPFEEPYSSQDLGYIAALDTHQIPRDYKSARPSDALYRLIRDHALNPALLQDFMDDPLRSVRRYPQLSDAEKTVVLSGHYGRLRVAMQRTTADVAREFAAQVLRSPSLATRYQQALSKVRERDGNTEKNVSGELRQMGYDTTIDDITVAFEELRGERAFWQGTYQVIVDAARKLELTLTSTDVLLDGKALRDVRFSEGTLSWRSADGNESDGSLHFSLVNLTSQALGATSYVGPQCHGVITLPGSEPGARDNAFGKVGVYSVEGLTEPPSADPLSYWLGTYTSQVAGRDGNWSDGPTVTLRAQGTGDARAVCEIDGKRVSQWSYVNDNLAWTQPDSSWSGAIVFFEISQEDQRHAVFTGRLWRHNFEASTVTLNAVGQQSR